MRDRRVHTTYMPATTPHLTLDRTYLAQTWGTIPYATIVANDQEFSELAYHVLPAACGYDAFEDYVAAQGRGDGDLAIALAERYEAHLRACTSFDQAFEVVRLYAAAMVLIAPPV